MPPLLPRSNRLRTALLVGAAAVLVAVVALVLANTGDSGSRHNVAKHPPGSSTTTTTRLILKIGPVSVQSAGPPAGVKQRAQLALMRATQKYFDDAIQAPVLHGKVDNNYATVFDRGVKAAATGKDRATLTEPARRALRNVHMSASRVRLDGLADPAGKLAFVATTFTVRIEASAPTGPVTIRRSTELTFANEFGQWVVTAYRVARQRTVGTNTTSTTTHAGTGNTV